MQHIVFDFDGPIFDGRRAAVLALNRTFDHFEKLYGRPQLYLDTLPLFPPNMLISLLYRKLDLVDREPIQIFYQDLLHAAEREIGIDKTVRERLEVLKDNGFKLAIFSGRQLDDLQSVLQDLGLARYFSSLGCRPQYHKPSGQYLRDLAAEFGVSMPEMPFLGDSDLDYLSADAADATYYHAGWSGEPNAKAFRQARAVFGSLTDFVDFVVEER